LLAGKRSIFENAMESWRYYEQGKVAASESGVGAFEVHTAAQQAFVLVDIDRSAEAVNLLASARTRAINSSSTLLRSWLAAAHGEALAASQQNKESLQAFDDASNLLSKGAIVSDGPYVVLDSVIWIVGAVMPWQGLVNQLRSVYLTCVGQP